MLILTSSSSGIMYRLVGALPCSNCFSMSFTLRGTLLSNSFGIFSSRILSVLFSSSVIYNNVFLVRSPAFREGIVSNGRCERIEIKSVATC